MARLCDLNHCSLQRTVWKSRSVHHPCCQVGHAFHHKGIQGHHCKLLLQTHTARSLLTRRRRGGTSDSSVATVPESYRIPPGFCWTASWLQRTLKSFLQKVRQKRCQNEHIEQNPHNDNSFLPMSFFIIPAEELPILNLPEFRMFMAICPSQEKFGVRINPTFKKASLC